MTRSMAIGVSIACLFTVLWSLAATAFTTEDGDFPAFYTGARIASQGKFARLHDVGLQQEVQVQATARPRGGITYFVRPHVYAAVLAPLGLADLRTAFVWFLLANGAIGIAVASWAAREFGPDALVLLSIFPVGIFGAAFGQDGALYLGIIVLSYHLHSRGKPLSAGLVLGLVTIKPHLVLLIPVAMLVQKRWRMLAGFLIAGAMEALVSVALAGWSGSMLYLDFLREQQEHLSPHPERMLNIDSLLLNAGVQSSALKILGLVLVLTMFGLACRRPQWWRALAAAMAGTLLIAPHTIPYDAVWMILPAWLVFFKSKSLAARSAAATFFTPLPYLLQLADQPWTALPACVLAVLTGAVAWDAFSENRLLQRPTSMSALANASAAS